MNKKPKTLHEANAEIREAFSQLVKIFKKRAKDKLFAAEYKFWAWVAARKVKK